MKKQTQVIIGVVLLLVGIVGCVWFYLCDRDNEVAFDALKFQAEYEDYNGRINEGNQKTYLSMDLPNYGPIKYSSYDEIFDILENGTGVIYFGFPTCPWCRNLVPTLIDSAIKAKIEKIYYLNILDDRDLKELNEKGKVETTRKGTEDYTKLVEKLYDFLPVYSGLEDETIKRIYMPTVVFVKDGKVLGLEQSLKTFQDRVQGDPYLAMNKAENKELAGIFNNYYKDIKKK